MSREDTGTSTFTAGEALAIHRLVKLNGTTERSIVYADAGDDPIGCTKKAVANADTGVPVWLLNGKPGTITCIANAAIAVNAPVWPAEDGKIDDFGLGNPIGWALKAATADGDELEVLRNSGAGIQAGRGTTHKLEDDFYTYTAADLWQIVATNSGDATIADGVGGVIVLSPSDGSVVDNDEAYLHTTFEVFKFAAGKPLYFQARVTQTEAATDDANWMVGLMDAVAADSLLDDGGGPAASYSGAVFFKVDGGTVIQAESSLAAAQVTDTDVGAVTSGVQMKLEIIYVPISATAAVIHFILNGVLVASNAYTFTGAVDMHAVFAIKQGSDTTDDTLSIDYCYCEQVR